MAKDGKDRDDGNGNGKLKRKKYEKELRKLQAELCRLQDWVKHKGLRVIIVFEGRDAAGKGGTIRAHHRAGEPARISRRRPARAVRPRKIADVHAALPAALSRRRARSSSSTAAGTTARAWNTSWASARKEQHRRFLDLCPQFEKYIMDGGIQLIKVWLEVSDKEQKRRFEARIDDPLRQWKLSPMDLPSRERWYDYSRARDMMLEATDTKHAPWHILHSDDKRRARLNCIAHLLELIPYKKVPREKVKLPKRSMKGAYDDQATLKGRKLVPQRY